MLNLSDAIAHSLAAAEAPPVEDVIDDDDEEEEEDLGEAYAVCANCHESNPAVSECGYARYSGTVEYSIRYDEVEYEYRDETDWWDEDVDYYECQECGYEASWNDLFEIRYTNKEYDEDDDDEEDY